MRRAAKVDGAVVALALALFAYRWMDLLGDTFWSAATGRAVLERAAWPTVDPFSFTAGTTRWVVHMPMTQLVFAAIVDGLARAQSVTPSAAGAPLPVPVASLTALAAFGALVEGAALALLVVPHARSRAGRTLGMVAAAAIVLVQRDDLSVRGQLFGDLGFAALLVLIARAKDGKRVPLWQPFALSAAWINFHSSFFLAAALPLFYAAMTALDREERRATKGFVAFAGAAALGSLVNPHGAALPVDLVRLLLRSSTAAIDLFQPPDLGRLDVVVALLATLAASAYALRRPRHTTEALALVTLACGASMARRYLPLAAMMALVVALRAAPPLPARAVGAPWLAVVALALAAIGVSARKDPYRDVPAVEAALVESLPLAGHVAHPYHWGGYFDFAWHERRRTFIDGRNQLFESGAFDAERRLAQGDHIEETLSAYRINTVVWERGALVHAWLLQSPAWEVVHEGRIAVVFRRTTPVRVAPPEGPSR